MSLKFKLKSKDEIPPDLHPLYLERDGSWFLDCPLPIAHLPSSIAHCALPLGACRRRHSTSTVSRSTFDVRPSPPPNIRVNPCHPWSALRPHSPLATPHLTMSLKFKL